MVQDEGEWAKARRRSLRISDENTEKKENGPLTWPSPLPPRPAASRCVKVVVGRRPMTQNWWWTHCNGINERGVVEVAQRSCCISVPDPKRSLSDRTTLPSEVKKTFTLDSVNIHHTNEQELQPQKKREEIAGEKVKKREMLQQFEGKEENELAVGETFHCSNKCK